MGLKILMSNGSNILISASSPETCTHCESETQDAVHISIEDPTRSPVLILGGILYREDILKLRDFFNSLNLSR